MIMTTIINAFAIELVKNPSNDPTLAFVAAAISPFE